VIDTVFEEGMWSAHDPDVPGVYGLGSTREEALADLAEAMAALTEYEADLVEDAEDLRAAEASRAEIQTGGVLLTQEQVDEQFGWEPRERVKAGSQTLGIVSDVHGDVVALDQALARMREMGCVTILCPGDLVDVEPFGEEVTQRLKAEGVTSIRGNHDRWAVERRRRAPDLRKDGLQSCDISDLAGGGAELSYEALRWLGALPSRWVGEIAGVRVAMWHARPGSDMEGIEPEKTSAAARRQLLEQARADVLIVGHTHDAFSLVAGQGLIVNPGACCSKLPAYRQEGSLTVPDGYRPATFGVLELPAKRFRVYQAEDGARVGGLSGSGSMRMTLVRTEPAGKKGAR
jgi:predicted phosphodiesterase/predicted RNase H-like HicB family nuclease